MGSNGGVVVMVITDLLKELMLLPAPSGYEKPVAYYLREKLSRYAEKVDIDLAGNVLAHMPGTQTGAPAVMIYAHMDQLGFIVRRVDPQGFLRIERLGGIPEKVLPGLQVSVLAADGRQIPGVIGSKSHHVTPPEEKYRVDPIADLYIDIGAGSAADVRKMGIDVGSPAVYRPSFQILADNRISGTSVDNRGGLAVLLQLAEKLKNQPVAPDVWLVGSVWEEFNLRGAALAARTCTPDAAIALDVVLAGDTPDLRDRFDIQVGGGPAVMLYNFHGRGTLNGTIPHPGLVSLAEQAAADLDMNLQRFAGVGILTDSAYVQLEGQGIAALELGFPTRYTHTPVEICAPGDLTQLADLIHAMLNKLDGSFNGCRY